MWSTHFTVWNVRFIRLTVQWMCGSQISLFGISGFEYYPFSPGVRFWASRSLLTVADTVPLGYTEAGMVRDLLIRCRFVCKIYIAKGLSK